MTNLVFVLLSAVLSSTLTYIFCAKRIIRQEDAFRTERDEIESLMNEFRRAAESYINQLELRLEETENLLKPEKKKISGKKIRVDRKRIPDIVKGLKSRGYSDEEIAQRLRISLTELELLIQNTESEASVN